MPKEGFEPSSRSITEAHAAAFPHASEAEKRTEAHGGLDSRHQVTAAAREALDAWASGGDARRLKLELLALLTRLEGAEE